MNPVDDATFALLEFLDAVGAVVREELRAWRERHAIRRVLPRARVIR